MFLAAKNRTALVALAAFASQTAGSSPQPPPRRRKGGRPPLPPAERRDCRLTVRLNLDELAAVRRKAIACGLPPGELLRMAALEVAIPAPVPELNRVAWLRLAKLEGAVSRLLVLGGTQLNAEDHEFFSELRDTVREIRAALLGSK